jgi:hypothetical protein
MNERLTKSKPMNTPKPNWSLVCIVLVLLAAGFVGVGSAQQTANATTNQSVSTVAQSSQTTDGLTGTVISPSPISPTVGDAPIPTAEPNDNWQNATPINTGHVVNGTLPIDDQDWFIFTVESSGSITVRIAASQANMSVFLYSSGGELLASSYVHPDEQISITGRANSAGGYYVFVRNEGNHTAEYGFEVSVEKTPIPADNSQAGNNGGGLPLSLIAAGVIIVLLGVILVFRTFDESNPDEENGHEQNQE